MALNRAIDITPDQREMLLLLLSRHLPNTEAWVYGSRVRGTSRPESDLDMVVFAIPPPAITLDIDDTCDAVHGDQQLPLFNAHYDTRCFLPVHVYHVETGRPVAVLLRLGKTPSGVEVRTLLKHLTRRICRHWPRTHDHQSRFR